MAIHQEVTLAAPPSTIYELLTNSEKFSLATGMPATIGAGEGAEFSLFAAHVEGRQIELIKNERVVQAWRFPGWPQGIYTLVRLTLVPVEEGTKLLLDQDAIPDGVSPLYDTWLEHIATNWATFYFKPFINYLQATLEVA